MASTAASTRPHYEHPPWDTKRDTAKILGLGDLSRLTVFVHSRQVRDAWQEYKDNYLDDFHRNRRKKTPDWRRVPTFEQIQVHLPHIDTQYRANIIITNWTDTHHIARLFARWRLELFGDPGAMPELYAIRNDQNQVDWVSYVLFRHLRHYEQGSKNKHNFLNLHGKGNPEKETQVPRQTPQRWSEVPAANTNHPGPEMMSSCDSQALTTSSVSMNGYSNHQYLYPNQDLTSAGYHAFYSQRYGGWYNWYNEASTFDPALNSDYNLQPNSFSMLSTPPNMPYDANGRFIPYSQEDSTIFIADSPSNLPQSYSTPHDGSQNPHGGTDSFPSTQVVAHSNTLGLRSHGHTTSTRSWGGRYRTI